MILTAPNAGKYTVRVVPYAVAGDSFTAKISLTANPVPPPPSTAPASGFNNFKPPATMRDAHNAGEPSLGYDWKNNLAMYQSSLSTYKVAFSDATSPAKATFTDVSANAAKGCPGGSTTSLDPILATDRVTGRTIESQLLDLRAIGSLGCVTGDDGKTWSTSQGGGLNSAVDHQTLGWGPYAPGGVAALRTYPRELYYCSQDIADASCSTSTDGGTTFGPAVPMYTIASNNPVIGTCGGLHGHVKVAPDGTAYVPNKNCTDSTGTHPAVVVSTDNGLHWAVRTVPGADSGASDPSVAIAKDGTVYLGWNGANNHAYTAVSRDKGKTWSTPQDVGAQLGLQNSVFPAAVAGDANRAAVAFIGTKTGGASDSADDSNGNSTFKGVCKGVWQLYVSSTFDGGKTWKTSNATGTNPVQRDSICVAGTTCGANRNLLDFIDATIDPQGRVLVGYADGCTAACVTTTSPTATTAGYRDAYATIARQSSGLRMFAANDSKPDLTVSGLQSFRDSSGLVHVTVLVRNIGSASASGVTGRFSDGYEAPGFGTSAAISLAAGTSQRVGVPWAGGHGQEDVVAVVDPANKIAELNESNNKTAKILTVS